ncbi:Uncharacterised protein g9587 [Pycnogonum litorale]
MAANENRYTRNKYAFTPLPDPDAIRDDKCGIGGCKPKWLQFFATPTCFLVIFSMIGMVQGAFFTYFVGVITTIEKRYAFKSQITGIISIADNISPVFICLIIGFFGGSGHRPRWIAIGTIIAGISAVISSMPYFIYGPMDWYTGSSSSNETNSGYQLCQDDHHHRLNFTSTGISDEECDVARKTSETTTAVSLLFLGNFINGIGSTAFYIIGTPYLDDNVSKNRIPLYLGIIYSVRLTGPTVGFVLSSTALKYYEDPFFDPKFGDSDPRWIGAWWIGFNVIALLLMIMGSILMLFPRELNFRRNEDGNKSKRIARTEKTFLEKCKEFPKAIANLTRNPILMSTSASVVFTALGMLGFFMFLPKYVESQFRQPAHKANLISGASTVAFMALGFLSSGFVIYKFKPSARLISAWNLLLGTLQVGCMLSLAFVGCDSKPIESDIVKSCAEDCRCTYETYSPVCHLENMTTYFSPCHAGCVSTYFDPDSKQTFQDCFCRKNSSRFDSDEMSTGYCDEGCDNLLIYAILLAICKLSGSTGRIGNFLVTIRSVSPEDKSLAMSLMSLFLTIFAFIPYPLVYGAIVDSVCVVWEESCSGDVGNCWIYDQRLFRYMFHGVTAGLIGLGLSFDTITWYYSKNVKHMYDDPEGEKTTDDDDSVNYNLSGSKRSLSAFQ